MPRLRLLLFSIVFLTPPIFLFPSAARGSCYKPGSSFPPVQGTTHIESISPQVGIAGITAVYVQGYCFGDTQGTGSVTVNGEPMTHIVFWTDAEIEFILPFDAQSGNLVVTSSSYGSDSSANEAGCKSTPPDWCGNDSINANFTVTPVNNPPLCCAPNTSPPAPLVSGTPSVPQYVAGTWYYSDGGQTMTLTLTQGPQNSNGTWPITGTQATFCPGQPFQVSGTLDQYGDFSLYLPCVLDNYNCIEWLVLDSGDVTSQGFALASPCPPSSPHQGFLQNSMDQAEDGYYALAVPPLFKSQTDLPAVETPTPQGWSLGPSELGSQYPTIGLWERAFPLLNGFVGFAGRFVYEQAGTGTTDTCWVPLSPTVKATGVTGGGWFVTQNGHWGYDGVGMRSQGVDWYQKNVTLPCHFTLVQDMYIDGRTQPYKYTTNQLTFEIQATKIYSEVQPANASLVKECENYPCLKGNCKP